MTPDHPGHPCPACGALLPERSKFCSECGAAVAARAEEESRRTVTLVFTDVTGSTAMGEALDPEALRRVMGRYFDVSRAAVEQHGGTVEKFVGDAVLAVFGLPVVHEDDALRAVRAAWDLNVAVTELAGELERELGVRLAIRTGVNTGSVVAGAARAGGSFATGDAVNTAARLEQAAGPGEVLLGPETYVLVRDAVEVGGVREVAAKGKALPVRARPLLGVDGQAAGRSRRLDVPLVGRSLESRTLDDALSRTVDSGRGHLVTVVGAPGMGKTRLVSEFVDHIGGRASVVQGRCVSYGAGLTFWPLAQALHQAVGLAGGESPEVVRHAVSTALLEAPDAATITELVLPLLGAADDQAGQDRTFWAVCRFLEHLARDHPVVVAIDDLHWAEPTLLELLEMVREETRDLPLLMLCQARPELLDEHPTWGQGSLNSVTFALEPFDASATEQALRAHLDGPTPEGLAAQVAEWSGGNPLFVEEIVAHLTEAGLLRRVDPGWEVVGDLRTAGVPPSVTALLRARLDRLPAPERRLLERVSVVGLEVDTSEARALADPADTADVGALLASLARRDLLRRTRTVSGETWSFRHLMVRDAAYDSLSKARRARLHEAFAAHLDDHQGEGGAEHAAFVAHHLEQAARHARDLAPRAPATAALLVRAVGATAHAAQTARDREDMAAAEVLLERAADLDSPDRDQHRDVLVRLVHHHTSRYETARVDEVLDQFASSLSEPVAPLDAAFLRCLRMCQLVDRGQPVDPAEADVATRGLLDLAEQEGDAVRQVIALLCLADLASLHAQWAVTFPLLDRIERVGDLHDRRGRDMHRMILHLYGSPMSILRDHAREAAARAATPRQRDRLALGELLARAALGEPGVAEEVAEPWVTAAVAEDTVDGLHLAMTRVLLGEPDRAVEVFRASLAPMVDRGDYGHASTYLMWMGLLLLEAGDPQGEVEDLVAQVVPWTPATDVLSVAFIGAARCVLAARQGRSEEASALAVDAVAAIDRSDQDWQRADVRRWVSEAARLSGDRATERRLLEEAGELYRSKEVHTFLRAVDERLGELSR